MNAARLSIDAAAYDSNPVYRIRVQRLLHTMQEMELLPILDADLAPELAGDPQLMFASPEPSPDPRTLLEIHPSYTTIQADLQRIETLSREHAVLVTGLDPQVHSSGSECAAFPHDPAQAARLVEDFLTSFDQHNVSWTLLTFEPDTMVTNYRYYDWSKLDDGLVCGAENGHGGIALEVMSHLWGVPLHGIYTVNQPSGGMVVARGGHISIYGRTMATRDFAAKDPPWPTKLGNIRVRVTDSKGVARFAPLLWAGGGWSIVNAAIPEATATGLTEVTIMRDDGSSNTSRILVADVAPALWTPSSDGRGPIKPVLRQRQRDGSTLVRLAAVGFRHARSKPIVKIDGIEVPVLSFGPEPGTTRDLITFRIPREFPIHGEADLYMTADGALSNVVRLELDKPGPKAELGRYLFYDKRMSVNGTTSCATCHRQDLAFTDGRAQAIGATGQMHPRSSMSLVNVGANHFFNWADIETRSLEEQALKPMLSTSPIELGLVEKAFAQVLRTDPAYRRLIRKAFPGESQPYTKNHIAGALAAFERTIVSRDSPYDRFQRGEANAISEAAKRGEILFFLDRGPACFRCHGGPDFNETAGGTAFHNTGLYNLPGQFSYPIPNRGLYEQSKIASDVGKFRVPTLRNIALTAPYMHDGSVSTLEGAIDHYAAGGRTILSGNWKGEGSKNRNKGKLMRGFVLTDQNRADLSAFLESLIDPTLLNDPRFGDPWVMH